MGTPSAARFDPPPDDALDLCGLLGLDFVNTVVRVGSSAVDLLATPEALSWWMIHAGGPDLEALLPDAWPDRRRLGQESVALRAALGELFGAVHDSTSLAGSAAFTVDRALRGADAWFRLDTPPSAGTAPTGGTAPAAERETPRPRVTRTFSPRGPLAPLAPIALSALETAGSVEPSRLRSCDAPDCRRWFVDSSKGGRRRWCSMARCGNRMKAARYRERHG